MSTDASGFDQYQRTQIQGVSSADDSTPTNIHVNPTTNAAIVEIENSGDIGGGTQYTEDAAAAANPVGTVLMLVREDGRAGSLTTTDGDNVALRGNNKGEAYVKTTDSDALLTTIDTDTSNISTKIDTLAGAVSGTEVQVDVLTSALPTGAATSANQDTGNTSVASIDTKTPALGQALAAASVPVVLTAAQLTTLTPPAAITGFATAANQLPDGHNVTVDNASLAVTGTFWQATQPVSGTVDLGATDNAVLDDIAAKLATIDADTSTLAAGVSTEYQVDVVGALPAGTNAIGKLAPNSGVDIGDVDVTSLPATPAGTNAIGKLLPPDVDVTTHTNYKKFYYTSTGAVTDGIIWSPGAGKRWHVLQMKIQVSAACTVTIEDDKAAGDEVIDKYEFAANSGVSNIYPEKYPWASEEDAADLLVTTTAGNIYISGVGYEV